MYQIVWYCQLTTSFDHFSHNLEYLKNTFQHSEKLFQLLEKFVLTLIWRKFFYLKLGKKTENLIWHFNKIVLTVGKIWYKGKIYYINGINIGGLTEKYPTYINIRYYENIGGIRCYYYKVNKFIWLIFNISWAFNYMNLADQTGMYITVSLIINFALWKF